MSDKTLTWSKYDSAVTETHTYRIEEVGRFISVIYGEKDKQQVQHYGFDSIEVAKQWAQEHHNQLGEKK